MENNIIVAEKINYLTNYVEKQFANSRGLHLNSKDWKVYIHVKTPQIYSFVINGTLKFGTDSYISGKSYVQYVKLSDYKKLEAPLLLLFLVGATEDEIIDYIVEFFSRTEVKLYCNDPSFCVVGDTAIPTISGAVKTISMLYEDYQKDIENWVFSSSGSNKSEKWGKIKKVWKSGKASELLKVTLSNNNSLTTTPEHFYITSDNMPIMAKHLEIGQQLLSTDGLYVKDIETILLDKSIDVYDMEIDNDYHNFLVSSGIYIHNSYWGAKYNLTQINSVYGPVEFRPPKIRDPQNNNFVCKHLWLVLLNYKTNIRDFAKNLLPYYRRIFGIQSPTGIERLKRNMGEKGFKQIIDQSIKNLSLLNDDVLYNKFNELTHNKLNAILEPINPMQKTENKDIENEIDDKLDENIDNSEDIDTNEIDENINKTRDELGEAIGNDYNSLMHKKRLKDGIKYKAVLEHKINTEFTPNDIDKIITDCLIKSKVKKHEKANSKNIR